MEDLAWCSEVPEALFQGEYAYEKKIGSDSGSGG